MTRGQKVFVCAFGAVAFFLLTNMLAGTSPEATTIAAILMVMFAILLVYELAMFMDDLVTNRGGRVAAPPSTWDPDNQWGDAEAHPDGGPGPYYPKRDI